MQVPIIICGFPRAGSTLLYNLLRGTLEGYEFYDREKSHKHVTRSRNIVTKKPQDILSVRTIKGMHPGSVFFFNLRDPRSVLCSSMTHASEVYKVSWDKTIKTDIKKGVVGEKKPGLLGYHEALKKAVYINSRRNFIVKYEDLVKDPDKIQEKLTAFGLKFTGSFSDYPFGDIPPRLKKQLNGVREIETSRLDSWKSHPDRIKDQFTQCPELFDVVQYWGYEKDNEWYEKLTK